MAAIAHQHSQRTAGGPGAPVGIAVRWEIGAGALLVSPGAGVLNGQAARLRACALVVRVEGDVARAELEVELTGEGRSVVSLGTAGPVERGESGGVVWVDAPGVVALTVRAGEVLYARTPVLERVLGLAGGVYDAPVLV
ncbi:MAG TPA: hypothetical protein PKE29_16575 [Phycisphaerales bacterium]|nr:hypothetical protein [Phycisphaerales bacterium]